MSFRRSAHQPPVGKLANHKLVDAIQQFHIRGRLQSLLAQFNAHYVLCSGISGSLCSIPAGQEF